MIDSFVVHQGQSIKNLLQDDLGLYFRDIPPDPYKLLKCFIFTALLHQYNELSLSIVKEIESFDHKWIVPTHIQQFEFRHYFLFYFGFRLSWGLLWANHLKSKGSLCVFFSPKSYHSVRSRSDLPSDLVFLINLFVSVSLGPMVLALVHLYIFISQKKSMPIYTNKQNSFFESPPIFSDILLIKHWQGRG